VWAHPNKAAAECESGFGEGFTMLGALPVGVVSLPVIIGNGIYAGNGERSPLAWLVMGYLTSTLGLAYSAFVFAVATESCAPGPMLQVATLMTAVTGLDLAFTIWAHTRPAAPAEEPTAVLRLSPLLAPDAGQGWFAGLGLIGQGF